MKMVKEQKPFKKATPKRIAKLQVGDIVMLRDGQITEVTKLQDKLSACTWTEAGHWADFEGNSNISDKDSDIVKIKNKKYIDSNES